MSIDPSKLRWYAHSCFVRLCHVIVELKDEFLMRDRPMATREQLDGAARNSFWQNAALKFNDATFKPAHDVRREAPRARSERVSKRRRSEYRAANKKEKVREFEMQSLGQGFPRNVGDFPRMCRKHAKRRQKTAPTNSSNRKIRFRLMTVGDRNRPR